VQIDETQYPHPKFGWWWMPTAWQARLKRNNAKESYLGILIGKSNEYV